MYALFHRCVTGTYLHSEPFIPWGNEAEFCIITILGGKIASLGDDFFNFRGQDFFYRIYTGRENMGGRCEIYYVN